MLIGNDFMVLKNDFGQSFIVIFEKYDITLIVCTKGTYVLHFKKPLFMKINLIILDFGAAMVLLICIIIYFPKKVLHYLNKYSM